MRCRSATQVTLCILLVLCTLFAARVTSGQNSDPLFSPQPTGKNAAIVLRGGRLLDSELAKNVRGLAQGSGFKNGTFLFQQCCGGGFLDDFDKELAGLGIPFVATSASRWDEVSFGVPSARELRAKGKRPPPNHPLRGLNPWTSVLLDALNANRNGSIVDIAGAAILADPLGTFGPGIKLGPTVIPGRSENGQRIVGKDASGQNLPSFQLKDPDALSFHAVLIAGLDNRDRYFENIHEVRDTLIRIWGEPDPISNPNVTIDILFGDGKVNASDGRKLPPGWKAKAATAANVEATFDALKSKLGPKEQLFVYVTDHGTSNSRISNLRGRVGRNTAQVGDFTLAPAEFAAYGLDPVNPWPTVTFEFDVPSTPAFGDQVILQFNDLAQFVTPVAGHNSVEIQVPDFFLKPNNVVALVNETDFDVDVGDTVFWGAPLDPIPDLSGLTSFLADDVQIDEPILHMVTGPGSQSQTLAGPYFDVNRTLSVQNLSDDPQASAILRGGASAAVPGTYELEFLGAPSGDSAQFIVGYDYSSLANFEYLSGAIIEVDLSEVIGDLQIELQVADSASHSVSVPLSADSTGLSYTGVLPDSSTTAVTLTETWQLEFQFTLTSQSDVRAVVDRILIAPEPNTELLIVLLTLLGLACYERAVRHSPTC